jgi:hypothetical protein
LANLYMRRFLLGWKQQGWESKLRAKIVSYADDVRHFTRASDPFRRKERSGEDDLWVNGLPESENRQEQEHAANAGVVRSR